MRQIYNKKGFTIVELMLAMGFVSALLLAIAMTVIQISHIYTRGMTLKSINQAGADISSEIQRGMVSVSPFSLSTNYRSDAWGGRLCTGQYSYIWNYGSAINTLNNSRNKYESDTSEIKFVKIYDPSLIYCTSSPVRNVDVGNAVELLGTGNDNSIISLHHFSVSSFTPATTSNQQIYSFEFLIGSNDPDVYDHLTNKCKIAELDYCAVNRFNVVIRAGMYNK